MILDIDGNRLDAVFLRETGALADSFTLIKQGAADTDGDGVPDAYELAHALDRHNPADAASDNEHDGYNARTEFLLGLDASVPDQFPWTVSRNTTAGGFEVRFPTLAERRYRVWWSPTLAGWNPASPVIPGDGSTVTWVDDGTTTGTPPDQVSARFYRLGVDPAP